MLVTVTFNPDIRLECDLIGYSLQDHRSADWPTGSVVDNFCSHYVLVTMTSNKT